MCGYKKLKSTFCVFSIFDTLFLALPALMMCYCMRLCDSLHLSCLDRGIGIRHFVSYLFVCLFVYLFGEVGVYFTSGAPGDQTN